MDIRSPLAFPVFAIISGMLLELYAWWRVLFAPAVLGVSKAPYFGLALVGALLAIAGSAAYAREG